MVHKDEFCYRAGIYVHDVDFLVKGLNVEHSTRNAETAHTNVEFVVVDSYAIVKVLWANQKTDFSIKKLL